MMENNKGKKKKKNKGRKKKKNKGRKKKKKTTDNKVVYLQISSGDWVKIDPHHGNGNDISVEQEAEMKVPAELDIDCGYSYCAANSKVYFTGGVKVIIYDFHNSVFDDQNFMGYKYTNKMFVYDPASRKWDDLEAPPLNVARAYHTMVAVGNLIYVFGGHYHGGNRVMNYFLKTREQWIEVYNLDEPSPKWEFLPISSAPPQDIFSSGAIFHHVVYELGNQILFFISGHIGSAYPIYSFNYVTKTWSCFDESLNYDNEEPWAYSLLRCNLYGGGVTILDHVLCWEYFGTIYAYDLSARQLISTHRLNQEFKLDMEFLEQPEDSYVFSEEAFIVCVGKSHILLIMFEFIPQSIYHFYRFRIDRNLDGFRLALDGSKTLQLQGASTNPMVVPRSSLLHHDNTVRRYPLT